MTADFSLRFINSVINMFRKGKDHGVESFMIPPDLFGITKTFISTEIPYCGLNEIKSTHLLKKFHKFINDGFTVGITCETRNLRSLFPLKDYKSSILSTKEIVIVVDNTLVKPNALSTIVLHGLSFQML